MLILMMAMRPMAMVWLALVGYSTNALTVDNVAVSGTIKGL